MSHPPARPRSHCSRTGLVVVDGKLIEKPVLRGMYRMLAIAERTEAG